MIKEKWLVEIMVEEEGEDANWTLEQKSDNLEKVIYDGLDFDNDIKIEVKILEVTKLYE